MNSAKFSHLETAAAAGVTVPPMLYITESDVAAELHIKKAQTFVTQHAAAKYIVRSAVSAEDGSQSAYAGVFKSSDAVAASELQQTIVEIFQENKKRAATTNNSGSINLILMPFIESQIGGVLFSPWLYFHNHALVEYADTPQAAVAGSNTQVGLLATHAGGVQSEVITHLPTSLQQQLRQSLSVLHSVFSFKLDVEWVYDGTTLFILQVRPITIAPIGIQTVQCAPDAVQKYTELSESIGKLSPLSFALLEYCYMYAHTYIDAMSIKGGRSFLRRVPCGNVLIDTHAYAAYYTNRRWYSAFSRGFKLQAAAHTCDSTSLDVTAFDLDACTEAFAVWQIAIATSYTKTKKISTFATPGEYEITNTINLDIYPTDTYLQRAKKNFLKTLEPLRQDVRAELMLAWCSDITNIEVPKNSHTYESEVLTSVEVYTPQAAAAGSGRIYGQPKSAPAQVIKNPLQWSGPLPTDTILVVPFVPQTWIPYLHTITGIVTSSLSTLSHVAITLREHNVTTVTIDATELTEIVDGEIISI